MVASIPVRSNYQHNLRTYLRLIYFAAIFIFRSFNLRCVVETNKNAAEEECIIGEEEAICIWAISITEVVGTCFVAGCGKVFERTAKQMHQSLCVTLASLRKPSKVYCGHEEIKRKGSSWSSKITPE